MSYKLATAFIEIVSKGVEEAKRQWHGLGDDMMGVFNVLSSSFGAELFNIRSLSDAARAAVHFTDMAVEAGKASIQLASAIEATGGKAGFTADELERLAAQMQAVTTLDDDDIVKAAKNMLMFEKVTGETFKRTLKAAGDLAAQGFGSIESMSMRLGRALEDPARGVGQLKRYGAVFTAEEQKILKHLVATNRVLEAQDMILDRIEGKVGGAAEKFAKTDEGRWTNIRRDIENLNEMMGKGILHDMADLGEIFVFAYSALAKFLTLGYQLWKIASFPLTFGINLNTLIKALTPAPEIMEKFRVVGEKLWKALLQVNHALEQIVGNIFQAFGKLIDAVLKPFGTSMAEIATGFIDWLVKMSEAFAEFVLDQAEWFEVLTSKWDEALSEIGGKGFVETLMAEKKKLEDLREKALPKRGPDAADKTIIDMKAGFQGFSDASKKLQEAILQSEAGTADPQVEMAQGIAEANTIAQQQLLAQLDTNKLLTDKPKVL